MTINRELTSFDPYILEIHKHYTHEKLHPLHYFEGKELYAKWQKTATELDYASWVNGKDQKTLLNKVTYISDEKDREKYLFTAEHIVKKEISNERSRYVFVVGLDQRIYYAKPKRCQFHHSSFFSGEAVLSAGEFIYIDKQLVAVTDNAGHYKPKKVHMLKILSCLSDLGIDLSKIDIILNSYKKVKDSLIAYNAFAYLQHQGPPLGASKIYTQNYLPRKKIFDKGWLGVSDLKEAEEFYKKHPDHIWCLRFCKERKEFRVYYRTFFGKKDEVLVMPGLNPEKTPFIDILRFVSKTYGPRMDYVMGIVSDNFQNIKQALTK